MQELIQSDTWLHVLGLVTQLLDFLRQPIFQRECLFKTSPLNHGSHLSVGVTAGAQLAISSPINANGRAVMIGCALVMKQQQALSLSQTPNNDHVCVIGRKSQLRASCWNIEAVRVLQLVRRRPHLEE